MHIDLNHCAVDGSVLLFLVPEETQLHLQQSREMLIGVSDSDALSLPKFGIIICVGICCATSA